MELGTGLVLIINPALVVALLLGAEISGVGIALGMCFGITLLALVLACWPRGSNAQAGSPAFWGMLVYNALDCTAARRPIHGRGTLRACCYGPPLRCTPPWLCCSSGPDVARVWPRQPNDDAN